MPTVAKSLTDDAFRHCSGEWVDVRDIALAHVLAIEKEAAGGKRVIISAGPFKFQDCGQLLVSLVRILLIHQ